ncbi:hypothetical protein H5410_035971 [Solanum commersonii]|uniref:DUF4283 domain-containing protein n=1 Tax=Solanum commersonii TaxID=4109 RepID=A0A9J5Y281_SOLCO|nr:hypothetical protein H5410_035971 [Solanum commersonii]
MARGQGRGKGRPRRETILTLGSANGARIELEGKKEVTPIVTPARGTLTEPTSIYATKGANQLHLSMRATISKTEPITIIVQQEGEVSINETGAPPVTTTVESWANLFDKNRSVTKGRALSYIPPQVIDRKSVIQLDKTEVDRETAKWKCAMIAYVLGKSPGYNTMHRYISQTWADVVAPEIFMHEERYFITEDFDFDKEFPTKIPIWVKFPYLPMNCWGCDSLSRIASAIGIPMFADECTTKQTRISFARMLVEVDVTKPLPEEINKCQVVGHVCLPEQAIRSRRAPKKVVHKWISKKVVKPDVTIAQEVPRQESSPIAGLSGVITSLQPSPNLTLENFPMLQPTPIRNGFSPLSMLWDEGDTIPPDKRG